MVVARGPREMRGKRKVLYTKPASALDRHNRFVERVPPQALIGHPEVTRP